MHDINGVELKVGDRAQIVENINLSYRNEFPHAEGQIVRLSLVQNNDAFTKDIVHASGNASMWYPKELRKIVCFICNDVGYVQDLQCPRCNR